MATLTLFVQRRGNKSIKALPKTIALRSHESTEILYRRLASASGLSVHRLRITTGSGGSDAIPNSRLTTVEQAGLQDQSRVFVKDLGPQISWRSVYVIEYIGPLIAHPAIYAYRLNHPSSTQTLLLILMILHFTKRELETIFIHRFSNATMPFRNIFKNSFHYWILSGVLLAWSFYSPAFSDAAATFPPSMMPPPNVLGGVVIFLIGESANLYTHLILRGLRSAGGNERGIPQGIGFNWVTCPNYLYEIVAWFGVLVIYPSWATVLFLIVGIVQMRAWARKKEMRYRHDFGDRYKFKRYTMLPGIC